MSYKRHFPPLLWGQGGKYQSAMKKGGQNATRFEERTSSKGLRASAWKSPAFEKKTSFNSFKHCLYGP